MTSSHVRRSMPIALNTLAFLLAVVIIRGRALFTPYSDPTIGLYLHIGRAWLDGSLPYVSAWDYRPPGFFALYAVAIGIFGSFFARDGLAIIALTVTTLAVGRIAFRISRIPGRADMWSSVFFILLSPVNDATTGAAEVEISAFIAYAILLALDKTANWKKTTMIGLLIGLAIQCKLSALPLAIIPIVLTLTRTKKLLTISASLLFGLAAPVLADILIYFKANQLSLLSDANIGATIRRASDNTLSSEFDRNRVWFLRQFSALAPQIELAFFGLGARANSSRIATVGWLSASLASIVLAGEFYERQFVLLSAPIAVLAGVGFCKVLNLFSAKKLCNAVVAVILICTFALHDYFETVQGATYALHRVVLHDLQWRPDPFDRAFSALKRVCKGDKSIYLMEESPFLYDMLGVTAPTKYPYSDTLLDNRLSSAAGIDGKAEIQRIFDARPHFVITSALDDFRYAPDRVYLVKHDLQVSYDLVENGGSFRIFRLHKAIN